MKRTVITVLLIAALRTVFAQASLDTIPVNYSGYHYTNWYYDDPCFQNGGWIDSCNRVIFLPSLYDMRSINWQYTTQPLKVKGLAAVTGVNHYTIRVRSLSQVAEYLYLYQLDTTTVDCGYSYRVPMIFRDSVRFDTATPKVMLLPRYINDTAPNTCKIYEGYFKTPVLVDSGFYIFQSMNNNHQTNGVFDHIPFWYLEMWTAYDVGNQCSNFNRDEVCPPVYCHSLELNIWADPPYFSNFGWKDHIGMFFPIIDRFEVRVESADSLTGSVSGGGLIPDGWKDTLRAFPSAGYEFTHWEDGNTDNPRIVTVTRDLEFTAYFEPTDRTYTLSLDVNNPEWGSVEGAGTYPVYQQVEIRAVPADDHFAFIGWSDGNWQNPRTVMLTSDTSFTANFEQVTGFDETGTPASQLVQIHPNPASGRVHVDVKSEGHCRIEFFDAAGRLRYARGFDGPAADIDISRLAPGAWIVRITTPDGTTYRRLVVK